VIGKRILIAVGMLSVFAATGHANESSKQKFLGKWSGSWDGQWPMSVNVLSVKGNSVTIDYTWPEGHAIQHGSIGGDTLTTENIVLTVSGPHSGVALCKCQIGRRADVTR
jgi:hypothetical protein